MRVVDRRVEKTRRLLYEALAALVREKAYDAISVKEILDRANVGRSTFYTHFDDKDELLASVLREMLCSAPPAHTQMSGTSLHEAFIGFSLPLFEHIHGHRATGNFPMGTRGRAILHEQLRKALVDVIVERTPREFSKRRKEKTEVSAELLALYIASTFVLVLNWWVGSRSRLSPKEVHAVFRELVMPTLNAISPEGRTSAVG